MQVYFIFIASICHAQSILQGISHFTGFLTGREPQDTIVSQVSHAGTDAVIDAADNLRGGVQSRALLNSNLLRKNVELLNKSGTTMKDIASQSYVGAGLIGATNSLKSNFIQPVLPNLNIASIFNGEGPMRSLVSNLFNGN